MRVGLSVDEVALGVEVIVNIGMDRGEDRAEPIMAPNGAEPSLATPLHSGGAG